MTIAASGPTYVQLPGNGSATVFAFPFKIFQATDLVVGFITSGGYALQPAGFTVQGVDNNGGGSITFTTAPPVGTTVDIRTITPQTQSTEFANLGRFLPEAHTEALDRLTRMVQDLYRQAYLFSIHGPDQEGTAWTALPPASSRANLGLLFDGSGLPTVGLLASTVITGAIVAGLLNVLTTTPILPTLVRSVAELNAGVTPTNYSFPELDVRRYGADPTGVADSSVAFNTAISVTQHYPLTGAIVRVPAGQYLVGSSGTFVTTTTQQSFSIEGDGVSQTWIVNGSANHPAFSFGDNGGVRNRIWVRRLAIGQKSGVSAVSGNVGIVLNEVGQGGISDVICFNFPGALNVGIQSNNCAQCDYTDIDCQGCLNDGIEWIACTDVYAVNVRSDANAADGFVINGTQGCFFRACTAFNNSNSGWGLGSTNPAVLPNMNNMFIECVGDTSGSHNWAITDSVSSVWIGCWGSTQISTGVNTFAAGFILSSQYCKFLLFDGCQAYFNNQDGFQVFDSGSSAPTDILFDNCLAGDTGHGNGQASGGGYGLSINGGCSHIRWAGGLFNSNATGAVQDSTTGGFRNQDVILAGNPIGFVTAATGSSAVTIGNSSIAVTHGLGFTPATSDIGISDLSSKAASSITSAWVSAVTATTFTVTTNANVAAANFQFRWEGRFPGS